MNLCQGVTNKNKLCCNYSKFPVQNPRFCGKHSGGYTYCRKRLEGKISKDEYGNVIVENNYWCGEKWYHELNNSCPKCIIKRKNPQKKSVKLNILRKRIKQGRPIPKNWESDEDYRSCLRFVFIYFFSEIAGSSFEAANEFIQNRNTDIIRFISIYENITEAVENLLRTVYENIQFVRFFFTVTSNSFTSNDVDYIYRNHELKKICDSMKIECLICYEKDVNSSQVLRCTHNIFVCEECIDKIYHKPNPKCPFCNLEILSTEWINTKPLETFQRKMISMHRYIYINKHII